MDKEFIVLSVVGNAPAVSQRELALRTGLSLGTINILVKKMIREGLIKLEKLPADRAAYILTPKGLEEKVDKTRSYLQIHYRAIEQMRYQLQMLIREHINTGQTVYLAIQQPELNELIQQVLIALGIKYADFSENKEPFIPVLADYDNGTRTTDCWINVHKYLKL